MKWYWYILLIFVFFLIGFAIGYHLKSDKLIVRNPIIISSGLTEKQQALSDSIVKLNAYLRIKQKTLIKAIKFKPTLNNADTIKPIVESIKTDTAKIVYLQSSLIASIKAYVVCQNSNDIKDSMINSIKKSLIQKDSVNWVLAQQNIKLKEKGRVLGWISGGLASGVGILLLIL